MLTHIITDWHSLDIKDRLCLALAIACLISGFALGFVTAWGWF